MAYGSIRQKEPEVNLNGHPRPDRGIERLPGSGAVFGMDATEATLKSARFGFRCEAEDTKRFFRPEQPVRARLVLPMAKMHNSLCHSQPGGATQQGFLRFPSLGEIVPGDQR